MPYVEKHIQTKAELREWLAADLAGLPTDRRQKLMNLLNANEGAIIRRHMILLRKTEYHINTGHRIRAIIYRTLLRKLQRKYCLHVTINACGKGLKIAHLGPILMNGQVRMGENCTIHMNTAFVAGGTDDAAPTLGNNVMVGYGAAILGGIIIADGVAIGANSVVNKDVLEENITVAGSPARKISNHGSEKWHTGVKERIRTGVEDEE